MLSISDRCAIALRAASLDDRLSWFAPPAPGGSAPSHVTSHLTAHGLSASASGSASGATAQDLLDAWQQAFSPGDRESFRQRLAWEGLDAEAVRAALADGAPPPRTAPAWTTWLLRFSQQAVALARDLASAGMPTESGWIAARDEPPFLELWIPIVRAMRVELIASCRDLAAELTSPVRHAIERQWLADISFWGELAVYESFRAFDGSSLSGASYPSGASGASSPSSSDVGSSSSAASLSSPAASGPSGPSSAIDGLAGLPGRASTHYRAFVTEMLREGLSPLFKSHAVLARLLATIAHTGVESARELIVRLDNDREAIAETFARRSDESDRDSTNSTNSADDMRRANGTDSTNGHGGAERKAGANGANGANRTRGLNGARTGRELGALVSLEPALSDPHDGRRRVMALQFASGLTLIYKPRDIGIERAWNTLLARMGRRGLPFAPPSLRVLDRDGYGWVEYARHEPLQSPHDAHDGHDDVHDARAYYRSAGALLFLSWLFGARDLHAENIVATRRGPVIVDAEMLLQPGGSGLAAPATVRPDATTCLDTGLLSLIHLSADGSIADIGGLRDSAVRLHDRAHASATQRRWLHQRSDDVRYVDVPRRPQMLANVVSLDGVEQPVERFAADVVEGFTAAYRCVQASTDRPGAKSEDRVEPSDANDPRDLTAPRALIGQSDLLTPFERCRTRVVFRASEQYAALQRALAHPKFHRRGVLRSCTMDALNRVFSAVPARPRVWPLVEEERRALERLDIPRFTARVDDTSVTPGGSAGPIYAVSGLEAVRGRLRRLSASDLARQTALVEEALTQSIAARFQNPPPATPPEAPPHAARGQAGSHAGRGDGGTSRGDSPDTRRDASLTMQSDAPQDEAQEAEEAQKAPREAPLDTRRSFADACREHAEWIGQELLASAKGASLALAWPGHRFRVDPDGRDLATHALYDGTAGPALFFAALHAVTGEDSWADAARAALQPLRAWVERHAAGALTRPSSSAPSSSSSSSSSTSSSPSESLPLGITSGIGSLIYSLVVVGRLTRDRSCLDLAWRAAGLITRERIAADDRFDLAGGAAGAIVALLALEREDEAHARALPDTEASLIDLLVGDDPMPDIMQGAASQLVASRLPDRQVAPSGQVSPKPPLSRQLDALLAACGDHLVETQVSRAAGAAWPARHGGFHVGFAHGAAGIGWALARLHARLPHEAYRRAASRAFAFARSQFVATRGNWPVLELTGPAAPPVPTWMHAWCHGAPGIALAQALVRRDAPAIGANEDDARAASARTAPQMNQRSQANETAQTRLTPQTERTTRAMPAMPAMQTAPTPPMSPTLTMPTTATDHVCCGNAGRAETLLTLAQIDGDAAQIEAARAITASLISRARARGHFRLAASGALYPTTDPGFFQGLSGIGYHLLRMAAPDVVPSVLAFETSSSRLTRSSSRESYDHA